MGVSTKNAAEFSMVKNELHGLCKMCWQLNFFLWRIKEFVAISG